MILPTQGNPIDKRVREAIDLRVKALKERAAGTSENLQAINYYLNSRTPWIRMISSVDTADQGSQLAQDNVLGMIQDTDNERLPSGTELSKDFGVRPKAGIKSMQVTSLGRFGALRDITVNFTCFSREQLDKYEKLFMRPGASILVEWGHSLYLTETGDTIKVNQMGPGYQKMFDGSRKTILGVYEDIKKLRDRYNYEYDAAFGLIKNFEWTFDGTGPTYECRITIGSCGEVIGSVDSQKPLPDSLARKYKDQNAYSDKPAPRVQETPSSTEASQSILEDPDFAALDPRLNAPSDSDQTNIGIQYQAEKKGEYVQERIEEVNDKFVPFLDARTDWEVSSMLKTFLYQDLICVYHLDRIKDAQIKLSRDTDLELFNRTSKPSSRSVPMFDSYIYVSDIEPTKVIEDSEQNTWLINKLGYQGQLLTIFFREEQEEAVEDLSDEDLQQLQEGEIASYERYRGMSYLRYADLLSFINNMIFFDENGPLLTFDTSTQGTMYYNNFVQSLDPRSCLLPSDVATLAKNTSITFKKGEGYASIGDIALNIAKLYEIAEQTRGSIKDFLDGVNTEIARATGQIIDLDVAYMEESAKYFIVDRRNYSKQELPTLSILGTDTIARTFKLSTSISNELSSAVAISLGDARGDTPRSDVSKTLFNFHKGISDRNLATRDEYPPAIARENPKVSGDYEEAQTKVALIDITLRSLYENRLFSELLSDNLINLFPKYIVEQAKEEDDLGGVLLPYTLTTTLDGLSGLQVMDSFQINTNILPSSYVKSAKVANLITGVDASVDKAGWTVNLKSQYYNTPGLVPDLRIKKYDPPVFKPEIVRGSFNNIQHNGVVLYTTDKRAPQNDLKIIKQWAKANFNASIQAQAVGMLVNLAKGLYPKDNLTADPQDLYGYTILITSTFRTLAAQSILRKAYLEKRQKGLANATPAAAPGNSMHNWGGAIDFNVLNSRTGKVLYNTKTAQSDWQKLGIQSIVARFGFEYGIQNDPIHIEYSAQGSTVYAAYQAGTAVDRFGNSVYEYATPELAVDLTKYATNQGIQLPEYQPQNIEIDYIDNLAASQENITPADATSSELLDLLGAEDVSDRTIDGLPQSVE